MALCVYGAVEEKTATMPACCFTLDTRPAGDPLAMLVAAPRVAELVSGWRWPNPLTIARKRL